MNDKLTNTYPAEWEWSGCTRDGAPFRVRPIRPDDVERERAFIMGLSGASRYNRMMGTMREPSARLVDQFVHVDYQRTMALVAMTGEGSEECMIAVARYAESDSAMQTCEFAIAVAEEWQGRGIGTLLMRSQMDDAVIEASCKL